MNKLKLICFSLTVFISIIDCMRNNKRDGLTLKQLLEKLNSRMNRNDAFTQNLLLETPNSRKNRNDDFMQNQLLETPNSRKNRNDDFTQNQLLDTPNSIINRIDDLFQNQLLETPNSQRNRGVASTPITKPAKQELFRAAPKPTMSRDEPAPTIVRDSPKPTFDRDEPKPSPVQKPVVFKTIQADKSDACSNRHPGDHIADPTNIKSFLVCGLYGGFQLMRCPGNLVFNEGLQRCDHHAVNVVSPCGSNPCHNGGKCSAIDQFTFTCECQEGFKGEHCDNRLVTRASICASNPCGENNECTPLSALSAVPFICVCNHGEGYGINCDANMFKSPCTRESAEQYHVSQLGPSSFIHCEYGSLHVKFCNKPLLWSMERHSCVYPENYF